MLTRYKLNKIAKNLEYFYNKANEEETESGLNWYLNFNNWVKDLSQLYGIDAFKIASVFSALSPRNKLDKNKFDTITVIEAYLNNINPDEIKVSTFHNNKYKAFNILKGLDSIKPSSQKTFAFVNNVANLDANFVTIDVWHLRAAFDKMILKQPTKLDYTQLQDLTIKLAKKHNITGYQYQAVIWESIRNNY